MIPTVGRIVHYTNLGDKDGKYPPQVQAAVITGVYRSTPNGVVLALDGVGEEALMAVDLLVFYRTGLFQCQQVPYSALIQERGTWTWPPQV